MNSQTTNQRGAGTPESAQRQNPRLTVAEPIRIYKLDGSNAAFDAICIDMAIGGISANVNRLAAPGELVVGEIVEIEFLISGVNKLPARHPARIVYRNSDEYGFAFLDLLGTCIA